MKNTRDLCTLLSALVLSFILIAGPAIADIKDETIRVGYQPSTHQIAFTTSLDRGFYLDELKDLGVTNIEEYQFGSGAPEMQAMMAGELDFAYVGSPPFITAVSNGLGGKIIAGVQIQGSDLVLRNDALYESPKDLKGLRIATFTAGTIQDTMLREWLSSSGVNPDTDVEISGMGPGDATTAMLAGQVDAVFLPHPSPVTITDAGIGRIIVQSGEMIPEHACCVLIVSDYMILNHPEIVLAFLKGHMVGTEYSLENPEEAAAIMASYTGQEADVILRSFDIWDGAWVSNPHIVIDSVMKYVEMQEELGYLTDHVSEEQLFDTSFWDSIQ